MHRVRYLIGIITLIAVVAAAFWIVRLLQQLDERPGVPVRIEFRDARGLRAGADVRYRGVRAGTVRSVTVSEDGSRAVVGALLDPRAAEHACVNTSFWIVTPRFAGITTGATGLDTLVRDSYLAFHTPDEPGTALAAGSLVAGRESPPPARENQKLGDVEHGDLLMEVLLPENHGLRPGSPVTFRGMQTGEVRRVELSPEGTYVTARIRILRRHRQTVTDRVAFWVARPQLSGALLSGFRVEDVSALLAPYVSYYGPPGVGLPVDDGHRAVASAARPAFEVADVPSEALQPRRSGAKAADDVAAVRIVYAATERDTFTPDDAIQHEGTGLLFVDRSGRPVVVTARSLVDAAFSERDGLGGDPEISDEQIKVMLPTGTVLHAGRVWVHPEGVDLAALVLTETPADLVGTSTDRLHFEENAAPDPPYTLRCAGPDGSALSPEPFDAADLPEPAARLGAPVVAGGKVIGVYGRVAGTDVEAAIVPIHLLPADLRPR